MEREKEKTGLKYATQADGFRFTETNMKPDRLTILLAFLREPYEIAAFLRVLLKRNQCAGSAILVIQAISLTASLLDTAFQHRQYLADVREIEFDRKLVLPVESRWRFLLAVSSGSRLLRREFKEEAIITVIFLAIDPRLQLHRHAIAGAVGMIEGELLGVGFCWC